MPHGPTFFPGKGTCIYCGDVRTKLTDEHIVPLSLGGVHVIREGSCRACGKITSRFERKVARDMWGDARISYDAPSRRKGQRPKFILMTDFEHPTKQIAVPVQKYPAGFVFYTMGLPGILQGLGEEADISKHWKLIVVSDDERREKFMKESGAKPVLTFRHVPQEFGQLLCKVAHGQLLTMLDLGDFSPICLPYIVGTKVNVSYVVGGIGKEVPPMLGTGYKLETFGFIPAPGRLLLIVSIRLYANAHTPVYQVVAGEVCGDAGIKKVLGKLGAYISWAPDDSVRS